MLVGQTGKSPPGRNNEKPWPHNPVRVVTSRMSAAHSLKTKAPLEATANREAVIDHYELIIATLQAHLADMRAQLVDARVARRFRPQAYETSVTASKGAVGQTPVPLKTHRFSAHPRRQKNKTLAPLLVPGWTTNWCHTVDHKLVPLPPS